MLKEIKSKLFIMIFGAVLPCILFPINTVVVFLINASIQSKYYNQDILKTAVINRNESFDHLAGIISFSIVGVLSLVVASIPVIMMYKKEKWVEKYGFKKCAWLHSAFVAVSAVIMIIFYYFALVKKA